MKTKILIIALMFFTIGSVFGNSSNDFTKIKQVTQFEKSVKKKVVVFVREIEAVIRMLDSAGNIIGVIIFYDDGTSQGFIFTD